MSGEPNSAVSLWQQWAHVATALVMALGAWIFRGQVKRIDAIEEAQKKSVSREELAAYIKDATEERRTMHKDNKDEFERICQRIDRLHETRE